MASTAPMLPTPVERPLAPAPAKSSDIPIPPADQMPYTCQTCSRRKVKCDKIAPTCSTCKRAKLTCTYQAPAPRRRKRKHEEDVRAKLQRYERMLQQNGLDPNDGEKMTSIAIPTQTSVSIRLNEPETARVGKLVSGASGKTRYIDSNLWRAIDDDDATQLSEEDEDESTAGDGHMHDPLTGALIGQTLSLVDLHPPYDTARALWSVYVHNVDPLCRVLHTPSMDPIVDSAARNPQCVTKPIECLLFAVYHFAIVSMTKEQATTILKEPQSVAQARYRHATSQALVNAGLLKSTDMQVLQAFVLFLLSVRTHYDPHTFWILSGAAFRIGQRMGIHRDGEVLGLSPFEVHMRRRLFWQMLAMDSIAAQISGTGIAVAPDSFDTRQPWNVDESQIWPGMTEQPQEKLGATDMIFCLTRAEVGKFHNQAKNALKLPDDPFATPQEIQQMEALNLMKRIEEFEDHLERRVVRYCDVVDPLHFVTVSLCRGSMTVIRLRVKISLSKHKPMTNENMHEVYQLAMRVVDYDIAVHDNPVLHRYIWHFRALFQHSAVACALTSLRNPVFLQPHEVRIAWEKIGKLYNNHPEITTGKRALHIAMARLTLKSWDASAYNAGIVSEPGFITTLRNLNRKKQRTSDGQQSISAPDTLVSSDTSPDSQGILTGLSTDDLNLNYDFSVDNMDWIYWDKMIQEFQSNTISPLNHIPIS